MGADIVNLDSRESQPRRLGEPALWTSLTDLQSLIRAAPPECQRAVQILFPQRLPWYTADPLHRQGPAAQPASPDPAILEELNMFERSTGAKSDDFPAEQHEPKTIGGQSSPAPVPSSRGEGAVIGRSIRIDGDLQGEEDLRIEGTVTGTVQLRNNALTIGSGGSITANVYAKSVTVEGRVDGDLFASERISIQKNAHVQGNITAPRVTLEDGAKFKGTIEMDPAAVENAFGAQARAGESRSRTEAAAKVISSPKAGGLADDALMAGSSGAATKSLAGR
jgi:cytoskeletal protein CcmA (bactofilin family)